MTLFSLMAASCFLFDDPSSSPSSNPLPPNDLDNLADGEFYAREWITGNFYKLKAEMLYEGDKCEIWAEIGKVGTKQAQDIAGEYDNIIRPLIIREFNSELYEGRDILEYANRLVGRTDGKLTILLLDIKDGYKTESDTYTAGYFFSGDFRPKGKYSAYYSNGRDMIYVDIYPGLKDQKNAKQTYTTFAHELQHLVNYVTRYQLRNSNSNININMDVWVNEGLSAYAEHLYLGSHPENSCVWLSDKRNTVKTGNNFFVWGNHDKEPYAIMDDYATVYLFFRWLYLQADTVTGLQSDIFREITFSEYHDYRAITDVAKKIDSTWADWEPLLRTWLAANHNPKAVYGYKNDLYLQEGHGSAYDWYKGIRIDPMGGSRVSLFPGEGVYSSIINHNSPFTPATFDRNPNIRYAGLANSGAINTSSPYSGNVLLTFNAGTGAAIAEPGSLAGVSASITASRTAADNAPPVEWAGPFVLDARDMLERNKNKAKGLSR